MTVVVRAATTSALGALSSLALASELAPDSPEASRAFVLLASTFGVSAIVLGVLLLFGKALVNHFTSSIERSFAKLDSIPSKEETDRNFKDVRDAIERTRDELTGRIEAVAAQYVDRESLIGELKGRVGALEGRRSSDLRFRAVE